MDFHLKQPIEKQQHQKESSEEEEQQQSPAKFPRLHLQLQQQQQQSPSNLNCFLPRSPCRIGGYFSTDQWQELELQALIFRHMVAGSAVPIELLHLVKKSLFHSSSFNLNTNNTFSYFHPSLLQGAGSWGKGGMDLEPGRCRRTDGKKWRCSREIVIGHKYCERHVHRGRNRSRKPVESAAALTSTGSDLLGVGIHRSSAFASSQQYAGVVAGGGGDGAHFSLSSPTPSFDIFQLNQGGSEANPDGKFQFKAQNESKLRPFFDDSHNNSATCLSISTPGVNPSSVDFLKLSTGNGGDHLIRKDDGEWSGGNQVAAAGGPLAEAFRSSTGASTTGVLHQLPRSASSTSCVAA